MQIIAYFSHIIAYKDLIKLSYINSFASIISRNIFIPLVVYLYLFYPVNELSNFLFFSILVILLISILTTYIFVLRSIGEGHRYIGYSSVLTATYIALNHNQEYMLIFLFSLISLLITFYKQYLDVSHKKGKNGMSSMSKNLNSELERIFLNSNKKMKFMSFPPIYDDYISYYYPNVIVMFHDNGLAIKKSSSYMLSPYKDLNIEFFLDKYMIDIYVTDNDLNINGFIKKEIDNVFIYSKAESMELV